MELVDTTDLKSVDLWLCQFESGSGHHTKTLQIQNFLTKKQASVCGRYSIEGNSKLTWSPFNACQQDVTGFVRCLR